ncbi:hypothetical protein [Corynebacterium marinum]|uniref:Putative secreted protein n=1 Tax=Corynebacterium marinum DSM 44953 TaxID=1224162 RepID=A0A0B6TF16_9CORY|nr:hypothetical protein [Corynebacterium marinum]AJK68592.1 putative secreted protein [Corynebacterium marinum DSM 44953]GGO14469.1 hypothetical protein GCM10010980_08900 [Corynebacterium marinum]
MKITTPLVAGAVALSLALGACSADSADTGSSPNEATTTYSTGDPSTSAEETRAAEDTEMMTPGEGVREAAVGKEAGFDCLEYGDCSVLFTVEALEILDSCPGSAYNEQPADTQLLRIPVLIKTKPSDFDYDPSTFAVWSDWSALTADGINQPLDGSTWCAEPREETHWSSRIRVGDTVRHVHYADLPVGTEELRLTETQSGGRWSFSADQIQGL